jgi:hypothetical protein
MVKTTMGEKSRAVPANLEYFQGSMFEMVASVAEIYRII